MMSLDSTQPAEETGRPETLNGQVYQQIRSWLLEGQFKPGAHLTIRTLAAKLGTSSMPVREALGKLEAARALVPGANRSFKVPLVTRPRLIELATVRAPLEGLAAELATKRLLDREIEQLVRLNDRMRNAAPSKNQHVYFSANFDFHWSIYRASGSSLLINMIEDLWLQNGPIYYFVYSDYSIFDVSVGRHDRIIEALKCRDAAQAREALICDITDANNYVVENLERLELEAAALKEKRNPRGVVKRSVAK